MDALSETATRVRSYTITMLSQGIEGNRISRRPFYHKNSKNTYAYPFFYFVVLFVFLAFSGAPKKPLPSTCLAFSFSFFCLFIIYSSPLCKM